MATTATYFQIGTSHVIRVNSDGRTKDVDLAQFAALDSELRDTAERAQQNPGTPVDVPSKSFARGVQPRRKTYGIQQ
jgi:hypothetical protein